MKTIEERAEEYANENWTLDEAYFACEDGYIKGATEQQKTKYAKKTFIAFVSLLLIEVFIPSTREMYIIYGVGGTIDHIKQDSVGNQLPHKVIEACDKFLEQELKEDNEE